MVHLRSRLAAFIRQRRGSMPQRAFARKTGLAQSSIMRIENEEQNVTLETLEMLCQTFHIDVAELFPPADSIRVYHAPVRRGVSAPMIHETRIEGVPATETTILQSALVPVAPEAASQPARKPGRKPRLSK